MGKTRMTATSNYGFNQIDCTQDTKMLFKDYVEKDSKENWQKADTVIKNVENKVDKVKSDIGNLVTLDGESKQNFNFIKNKVIQDGLVYNKKVQSSNTEAIQINAPSNTIMCNFTPTNTGWLFSMKDSSNSRSLWGVSLSSSGTLKLANPVDGSLIVDTNIPIGLNSPQKLVITQIKDGVVFVTYNDITVKCTSELLIVGSIVHKYNTIISTSEYEIIAYNRSLTPEEIQHNFSVIDNQESIKELHTTDSTGKTSILKLGSDTDHVEDRAGRTQEQINRTFYKRMCKEIPSPSGEPITVENGEEGYVLSAEVKGQTIKNYIHGSKINCTTPAYKFIPISENINDFTQLEPGKTYTLSYNVLKTLNKILRNTPVITYDDETKVYQGFDNFNNVTGVKSWTFTIPIGKKIKAFDWWVSGQDSTTSDIGDIEVDIFSLVEGSTQFFEKLPFGLSSTQAIISNNGEKYTIYHPTELNEDGSKKVISLPFAEDKIELKSDGSIVWTDTHIYKILDGSEEYALHDASMTNTTSYRMSFVGNLNANAKIYCNNLNTIDGIYSKDVEGVGTHVTVQYPPYVRLIKDKVGNTVEGLKSYLKQQYDAGNPIVICCQSPSTVITHIPKELVPTTLTHNQTNILDVGGAVKPSSFKVTVPTTDGIKKEYTLTPINGWTGTAKANLLQTGDTGLVLDLTIPSSFNVSICSLATELRPKAERTVLGYNGNTPVVVKIGTDGTVKLPISTTGTVKLDDTYKL